MKPEILKARKDLAASFLKGETNFQSSAFGTQLVVVGYSGKVTGIELREVSGGNATKRTVQQGPQVINGVTVAEVGEYSVSLSLVFDGGKSISLSTLTQHAQSVVGDDNAMQLPGKEWAKFIGKTLTCTKSDPDNNKMINRTQVIDGKTQQVERPTRIYEFEVA